MQQDTIPHLDELEKTEKEAINLLFIGVFADDENENERYIETITGMTKHFIESVDHCVKTSAEDKRTSIISVAISFLQMSLNIICQSMEDKMKENILRMAFPDYAITATKRVVPDPEPEAKVVQPESLNESPIEQLKLTPSEIEPQPESTHESVNESVIDEL